MIQEMIKKYVLGKSTEFNIWQVKGTSSPEQQH